MKQIIFIAFISLASFSFSQELSPIEFYRAISNDSVQLLDVRTQREYNSGYIENTMQADWNNQEEFMSRIEALDKTKPVYIYCLSGGRSAAAQKWMLENGFTSVINLKGGIVAWENEKNLYLIADKKRESVNIEQELKAYPNAKKVLVEISTTYCPPCRKMQPIVEELITEGVKIHKVDGSNLNCSKYNVNAFPTFIVFENGKEVARKEGVSTKEELKELLK